VVSDNCSETAPRDIVRKQYCVSERAFRSRGCLELTDQKPGLFVGLSQRLEGTFSALDNRSMNLSSSQTRSPTDRPGRTSNNDGLIGSQRRSPRSVLNLVMVVMRSRLSTTMPTSGGSGSLRRRR
jgi:hypothetical protein